MIDEFWHLLSGPTDNSPAQVAARMTVASFLGFVVAGVRRATTRTAAEPLGPTLVLLAPLVALVLMAVGDSSARAFSLVGTLAIVRFRTTVDDTRDTAFVIFAVALGMACGVGLVKVAFAGTIVVSLAAFIMYAATLAGVVTHPGWTVTVEVLKEHEPEQLVKSTMAIHMKRWRSEAATTASKGTNIKVVFKSLPRTSATPTALLRDLLAVPGVTDAEIHCG